jgi:hypothetical protein
MSFIDVSPGSSSSSSSSSLHHASLVDSSLHSPALLELLDVKLSQPVIDYVVDCVAETVDYAMGRPSSSSRGKPQRRENPAFTTFVSDVITRAEITTPIILASLVYIDRAKPHLHIALEEWAHERVFLGALITASKYLNDSTLKNVHWALCTGVFGKRDIGRIEREFLDVLDFQLGVTEDDLLSHHDNLSAVALSSHGHRISAIHQPHNQHAPHTLGVPALDPSSPSSSASSGYLSTPNSLGSSSPPSVATSSSSVSSISPEPTKAMAQSKPRRPKRSSFHLASSTLELLRSLPVTTHHRHKRVSTQNERHYRPMPIMPPVGA